jgi:hypothetical protein
VSTVDNNDDAEDANNADDAGGTTIPPQQETHGPGSSTEIYYYVKVFEYVTNKSIDLAALEKTLKQPRRPSWLSTWIVEVLIIMTQWH